MVHFFWQKVNHKLIFSVNVLQLILKLNRFPTIGLCWSHYSAIKSIYMRSEVYSIVKSIYLQIFLFNFNSYFYVFILFSFFFSDFNLAPRIFGNVFSLFCVSFWSVPFLNYIILLILFHSRFSYRNQLNQPNIGISIVN